MIEKWFWWLNQCFWAWRIIWDNFLVQIYVNIQDLGLFGGSDPGTELDHLKEVKKHFKE